MFGFIKKLFTREAVLNKDPNLGWRTIYGNMENSVDFGGGLEVSESKALGISAVFLAIRTISEDIGMLSRKVYEASPGDKSLEWQENHPVDWLINHEPNEDQTAMSFWETMVSHVLGWGNGYAEIVRNGAFVPSALNTILPDRVTPMMDKNGEIWYKVFDPMKGHHVHLSKWDVLHIHGIGFDGILGYSPIRTLSNSFGVTIGADSTARRFFSNGLRPSGFLTHPGELGEKGRARLQGDIAANSGIQNSQKTLILEEGMDWKPITISPADAQLLTTRQYSVFEVARAFRIPPSKLMSLEKAAYNTLEQQEMEYVKCLRPWCIRIAQEVKRKLLPSNRPNLRVIHDLGPIELSDARSRSEFYRNMSVVAAISPNEIRNREGWNPLPGKGGDDTFLQNNMIPLERAVEEPPEPPAPAEPVKNPEPGPADPAKETAPDANLASAFRDLFRAGVARYRHLERDRVARGKADPEFLEKAAQDALGPTCQAFRTAFRIGCPEPNFLVRCPSSDDEVVARFMEEV